jgi:pimeloyl-ACP methyl ester carboxylesterase
LRHITGASDLNDARKKLSDYNLRGIANHVKCPTLIVHGEKDFITDVEGARRVYAELQGPKDLRVIRDGEHMAANFYPEVRPLIWDWLSNELQK